MPTTLDEVLELEALLAEEHQRRQAAEKVLREIARSESPHDPRELARKHLDLYVT